VVFDNSTIVSALVFSNDRLAWLRRHWRDGGCLPLISLATASELTRVLAYPKFRLSADERRELLADYLPFCDVVEVTERCATKCRDANDQMFLDLAESGRADLVVSSDQDLLVLAGQTPFLIETPEAYRRRVFESP
jgi:putative PIN family toxin of toxin-antitoxin system